METNALPTAAGVGRVALRVADLEAAAAFYADVLGFERLGSASVAPPADGEHAILGVGGEPLLVLDGIPNAPPRGQVEAGLFHVAIRLPDRNALGAVAARLRERDLLDGASDHAVSEALYLRDPEGNGLELYVDRPREAWPTANSRVAMVTEPLDLDELTALAPDAAEAGGAGDGSTLTASLPGGTTIGHVHLEVTDLEATRTFYTDALGMGVRQRMGDQALFLAAGDYHHHVGANTWQRRSEPAGAQSLGLAWFEVVTPDDGALEAAADRIEEAGYTVQRSRGENASEVVATDPDGISLRLRVDADVAAPTGE